MAPSFQFEGNRLIYSLRLLAYPGDTFTSEESCRCAFAVLATRRGDRTPPSHEKNLDEWARVLDVLIAAEPKAWIESNYQPAPSPSPRPPLVTKERAEEAAHLLSRRGSNEY